MAKRPRWPKHMSFMVSQTHQEEIKTIAEEHETSEGHVIRRLLAWGLERYYREGQHLGPDE